MSDVVFDPAMHVYTVDGDRVPHVTEIIAAARAFTPNEYAQFYAERGSAVHYVCRLDDEGDLDESTMNDAVKPYLEGWRKFKAESGFDFSGVEIECQKHSKVLGFAGTIDRFLNHKEQPIVIDIKTGVVHPATGLQLAGYALLIDHMMYGTKRIAVHLSKEGNYKINEYADHLGDRSAFLACLTVVNWKRKNNIMWRE